MTAATEPEEGVRGQGSAHGKLILLGEHAVVYGAPALAVGIGSGLRATVTRQREPDAVLSLLGERCVADATSANALERAFAALLEAEVAPTSRAAGLEVCVQGTLPAGVGLGFSAAAGVAIARALASVDGSADDDQVWSRAMAWESVFHGDASGIDVAAAMHGGCLRFVRGQGRRPVVLGAGLRFCVGLTGARSATKAMVEVVAELRARRRVVVDKAIDGVAALVDSAVGALEAGEAQELGELMNLNQMLLAGLMVSSEEIELLCGEAREAGALGAKLTGAGGGGAVVALCGIATTEQSGQISASVLERWQKRGFEGFEVLMCGP